MLQSFSLINALMLLILQKIYKTPFIFAPFDPANRLILVRALFDGSNRKDGSNIQRRSRLNLWTNPTLNNLRIERQWQNNLDGGTPGTLLLFFQ